MLNLKEKINIEKLKEYGFTSFKVNRNQTNWYRIFAHSHQGMGNMILVNNIDREVRITKYEGVEDTRVHAYPHIRMRDKKMVEDVIVELAENDVIESR